MDAAHVWLDDAIGDFKSEVSRAETGNLDPKLSKAEHKDAIGVLHSLKTKAKRGHLKVGFGPEFQARLIRRVSYLIELRPRFSNGHPPPRLFRLYYAEPRTVDGALLPLVLATKPNSGESEEQNKSIDDAKARSRVWSLMNGATS